MPSGPAATVLQFRRAMDGLDTPAVTTILLANNDQQPIVKQTQHLADALAHLRKALSQAFGARAQSMLDRPAEPLKEQINGDAAIVTTPDGQVHLIKVLGQWRIPIKEKKIDQIQERAAQLQVLAEAIEGIAQETESGEFDNVEEAARATQEELMRGRQIARAATTQTNQ